LEGEDKSEGEAQQHQMAETKPRATLEIFSGTRSFTKVAREMLDETHAAFLTLDNDRFFSNNTTFTCDILDFQYMAKLSPFYITHVWASCPCTQYSVARSKAKTPRDLAGADRLVGQTLAIIDWIREYNNSEVTFYIENPSHSLLKTRPVMTERNYPYYDLTYCRYAPEWGVRKATRIYSNICKDKFIPKICLGARFCKACIPSSRVKGRYVHKNTPKGRFWLHGEWKSVDDKRRWLGRVPPKLCEALIKASF